MHFWKGAKFAGSVWHPMTKMLSASGGLRPLNPWPGALPLDLHYRLVLRTRHGVPQPLTPSTAYDPLEKNPVGAPVGGLYYTVWSKSAVGNADCSLKKYIYCVIYYNFRHTFVPYSRLWPDGEVELAHYCRRFGDLFRWFLHLRLYAECSPYFYCRFVWPILMKFGKMTHTPPLQRTDR